jgi:hypothetical protein
MVPARYIALHFSFFFLRFYADEEVKNSRHIVRDERDSSSIDDPHISRMANGSDASMLKKRVRHTARYLHDREMCIRNSIPTCHRRLAFFVDGSAL